MNNLIFSLYQWSGYTGELTSDIIMKLDGLESKRFVCYWEPGKESVNRSQENSIQTAYRNLMNLVDLIYAYKANGLVYPVHSLVLKSACEFMNMIEDNYPALIANDSLISSSYVKETEPLYLESISEAKLCVNQTSIFIVLRTTLQEAFTCIENKIKNPQHLLTQEFVFGKELIKLVQRQYESRGQLFRTLFGLNFDSEEFLLKYQDYISNGLAKILSPSEKIVSLLSILSNIRKVQFSKGTSYFYEVDLKREMEEWLLEQLHLLRPAMN